MLFLHRNFPVRLFNAPRGTFTTFSGKPISAGSDGQADIRGILTINGVGVAIEIEVKTGSGILNKDQKLWRAMVVAMGGIYIVARTLLCLKHDMDENYKRILAMMK